MPKSVFLNSLSQELSWEDRQLLRFDWSQNLLPGTCAVLPLDQVALAKQLLAEQCATDLEELESAMKLGVDRRGSAWMPDIPRR